MSANDIFVLILKGEITMSGTKETICSNCEHLLVCKYKDELLSKVKSVNEIMINSRFSCKFVCPDYFKKNTIGIRNVEEK